MIGYPEIPCRLACFSNVGGRRAEGKSTASQATLGPSRLLHHHSHSLEVLISRISLPDCGHAQPAELENAEVAGSVQQTCRWQGGQLLSAPTKANEDPKEAGQTRNQLPHFSIWQQWVLRNESLTLSSGAFNTAQYDTFKAVYLPPSLFYATYICLKLS